MRLNKPTNWKEVARVIYTDTYVTNAPYLTSASEPALQSGTRGTAYTITDHVISNDTLTISTFKPVATFIDRADLAQFKLYQAVEAGNLQGRIISEGVESAMLADHAAWTDFGDTGGGVLGLGSTPIAVSAVNIDEIIRGVRREIEKANGIDMMNDKGVFFVWRPQDKEALEQFMQANGFSVADAALKNGIKGGYYALDSFHYVSNSHTANHVFAGVRGLYTIGLLKSTFGKIVVNQDPPAKAGDTAGPVSGISVVSRLDMGLLTPTKFKPVLFDLNVV